MYNFAKKAKNFAKRTHDWLKDLVKNPIVLPISFCLLIFYYGTLVIFFLAAAKFGWCLLSFFIFLIFCKWLLDTIADPFFPFKLAMYYQPMILAS